MSMHRSFDPVPTVEECATAVAKAVDARRDRHGDRAGLIQGVTLDPHRGRDGWWLVGRVLDEGDESTFSVWYLPGERNAGIGASTPPTFSDN